MTLTHSMMNEYLRRMSSTGLKAYIRSDILLYDTWDSMVSDEVAKVTVHSRYLPGFLSFQKSVDRYPINQKQNVTLSAKDVKNRVYSSYSLKSNVVMAVVNDG